MTTLCEHVLQSLSLWNSTWETIKDYALVLLAKAVVNTCKDIYHELIRDKLTVVNISLGSLAEFCTILDFCAKHVACRNMTETILLNHQIALSTLS